MVDTTSRGRMGVPLGQDCIVTTVYPIDDRFDSYCPHPSMPGANPGPPTTSPNTNYAILKHRMSWMRYLKSGG
ncbi:MAG: hypothetical protein ACFFDN_01990 [Candidatus Hodarchaeota archaeon]